MKPANDSADQYACRNQTSAESPRHQRQFYLWLVLTLVLVAPLARVVLQVLGLSDFASSIAGLILSLLILVPLALAALREVQDRKKAGLNPPVIPVTSRALVAWVVTAILLWVLYPFLVAWQGFVLPVLPTFVAFFAVRRLMQWRAQGLARQ